MAVDGQVGAHRAVKSALCHVEGLERSDREIAEHVGVSPPTVGKYRVEVEATVKVLQSNASRTEDSTDSHSACPRKGRDGRTINTAKIGKKSSKRTKRGEVKISRNAFEVKLGHSNTSRPETIEALYPEFDVVRLWVYVNDDPTTNVKHTYIWIDQNDYVHVTNCSDPGDGSETHDDGYYYCSDITDEFNRFPFGRTDRIASSGNDEIIFWACE